MDVEVELAGAKYLGADVAPSLISYLRSQFPEKDFTVLDISKDTLPKVDLIFLSRSVGTPVQSRYTVGVNKY